jgi:heme-degrading monooxygenase HmoA
MITFTRTFLLPQNNPEIALNKIKHLYKEVMPTQPGFIASQLEFIDGGKRIVAIANWESEEQFIALQNTNAFRELARHIG